MHICGKPEIEMAAVRPTAQNISGKNGLSAGILAELEVMTCLDKHWA